MRRNVIVSQFAAVAAMYSAMHAHSAGVCCSLLDHEISLSCTKFVAPDVEQRVAASPAKSASEKDSSGEARFDCIAHRG